MNILSKEFYVNGGKNNCPAKYQELYEQWTIPSKTIVDMFGDDGPDAFTKGDTLYKALKKSNVGQYALRIAIEALKQVRTNIEFEGSYEQDILKLAEKVLSDEYRVNKYSYES